MPIENKDVFLFYYGDTFLGEVSDLKITADRMELPRCVDCDSPVQFDSPKETKNHE